MSAADDETPFGSRRTSTPAAPRVGDVLSRRYRLERILGSGGMSDVFLATDLLSQQTLHRDPSVAIKILRSDLLNQLGSLNVVNLEASHMMQLAHPNIASVFNFEVHEGVSYIVMEYVRGKLLSEYIQAHPDGVPLRTAATLISGMAAGLSHAHDRQILHLDFKPSNVFIVASGAVKVFDFGIAHTLAANAGPSVTQIANAATPAYSSPERLMGNIDLDVRDDIFSFAVTVYELLSGRHPYHRQIPLAANAPVPERIPNLSRQQWAALQRGLAIDRAQRATSVMEVAQPLLHASRFSAIPGKELLSQLLGRLQRLIRPAAATITLAPGPAAEAQMWVADRPIHLPDEDRLQYIDYAKAVFGVIDHPNTTPPLTIVINGAFGVGKSSVAFLTQHLLMSKLEDAGEKHHITAWMLLGRYRGSASLRTSFMRDFVRDLYFAQPLGYRFLNRLPESFLLRGEVRTRRALYVGLLAGAWAAITYVAHGQITAKMPDFANYSALVGLILTSCVGLIAWLASTLGSLKSLADYVDPTYDTSSAAHHGDARRQIDKMIQKITRPGRRFVLFVDDLERSPERTLEVLDVIESIFSVPNCIVVIPTDTEMLGDALERYGKVRDGRKYLEKYIQLQFDMPPVENSRLLELLMRPDNEPLEAARPPDATLAGSTLVPLGSQTIARARGRIDERIRQSGITHSVDNTRMVIPPKQWEQLVDERKQRALPETQFYRTALQLAVVLAGRDVRAAKRISNQVRLYVFVLFQRGLMHASSPLTPEHVGRWIALRELWPDIMWLVSRSPDLFAVLDEWAVDEAAQDALEVLHQIVGRSGSPSGSELAGLMAPWAPAKRKALRNFLKADPRLTAVIDELSYLRRSIEAA